MSPFEIFYILLMLSLLLFWVPIFRSSVPSNGLLFVPAVLGVLACGYEIYTRFILGPKVMGPIRVDILLISVLLIIAYALGASGLLQSRRQGAPVGAVFLVTLIIPLLAVTGLSVQWWKIGKETAELTALIEDQNKLLFEAKFRDEETIGRYFGNLVSADKPLVGHWRAVEGRHPGRLVINDEGKAWGFIQCQDSECLLGTGEMEGTRLTLAHRMLPSYHFEVREVSPQKLTLVRIEEKPQTAASPPKTSTFVKEAPPVFSTGEQVENLKYLGSFSHLKDHKQHITVTQLWLWQGPEGPLAVMVHDTPVKGRKAEFIHAWNLGEGRPTGNPGEYAFTPPARFRQVRAGLPVNGAIELTLEKKSDGTETLVLVEKEYLFDDTIFLAPTVSVQKWKQWFHAVLTGHFFTWNVPEVLPG